ncbi:MAG: WYL domain-containing protein [Candidatus Eremiobacterota bacterium]
MPDSGYEEINFKRKQERKYGPNNKLVNILNLLYMLLKGDNKNTEYYSRILKCTKSAVKKYIDEIRYTYDLSGEYRIFDIIYDRNKKQYNLCTTRDVFVNCLPEEVEALYMAVKYLSGMEGTPLEFLDELENKLKQYYHKGLKKRREKPVYLSAPKTRSRLSDLLDKINDAMVGKDRKKLIIDYVKTREKQSEKREIVPYSLMVYDYEWYVRAFCLKDKVLKTFVVNQMDIKGEPVELTGSEREELPENPDLSVVHMWDWSDPNEDWEPVKVRLKFTGFKADEMRKKLAYRQEHRSQKIEEEQKDYIIVSFEVKKPFNMVSWILKYGSHVTVLEPEELRERIKDEVSKIMTLYA